MDSEFSKLEDALNCLGKHQRAVYVLRRYGKFSYQEIADIIGDTLGTVRSTIHQARMKLLDKLQDAHDVLKY